VGTRSASRRGLLAATDFASELSSSGFTVVSGLAAGIDTAAHEATLNTGGRTIAVIGTGLRKSYPAKNASLQSRLSEESAVISQFWPDAPPTRTSFPMRNVVMSGIALATVVIEASGESGARMQARLALEHGRPVFLLRSLLEHEWARDYAERAGTHVVSSPSEVIAGLERLTTLDALSLTP
jgi:DNA processing protein